MKNVVTFLTLFLLAGISVSAQVSVNNDATPPDNSAMLDVKSSNKGFLPPRVALTALNVADPVVSPTAGLLLYNTATAGIYPNNVIPGYYYWNGTTWTSLGLPSGTDGQTLRNDGNNWIANSVLYNDGTNVGIGTITSHKFTVAGTTETVRLIGPGPWGETAKLNFGDGEYVYIYEDLDDHFYIQSRLGTSIMGGNVGIGTTTPAEVLTVAGMIQTTSGGIKYPDNTIQTTAAVANNIHTIGESYGGGIVFAVFDGGQHGLIAAPTDQSAGVVWGNGPITNAARYGNYSGQYNTERIIQVLGTGAYAAQLCANLSIGDFGDWYLPSSSELSTLYQNKMVVGGFSNAAYWSSNEGGPYSLDAWMVDFTAGVSTTFSKDSFFKVRAIRAF